MARIRSIHPGLFTDEAFMTASPPARLLIIGIWCEAFDDGVFEWKPLTLKVRLMPADAIEVAPLLDELEELNFVRRFTAKGKIYGVIRNFQKYQRPKKPNRSGILPDELRPYALGEGDVPEPVEEEFGTGGEPLPPGEEDGGGRGEEDGAGARARSREAAPARARRGTDEHGSWLRGLVGEEPVLMDPNTEPVLQLLAEGLTQADVEAGIAAAMADPGFRPRTWKSLVGWIRTSARERLAAAPKAWPPPRLAKPQPLAGLDPGLARQTQFNRALAFHRGEWRPVWDNCFMPGHPDCTTPEDVLDEARIAFNVEQTESPTERAARMGYIPIH